MQFIRRRARRAAMLVAAVTAFAAGLALATAPEARAESAPIRVGGKNFTEQLLLSSITSKYLRAKGFSTELTAGLGSTLMRQAMESNQLDVVWDYTGTALIVFNKGEEKLDAKGTYARVRQMDGARGLVWLDASGINNTYAL
ncbi:MAG: glycine/betaine ABC transporter substrate-binding protein, partial [Cupriavidus sp.]|nr:glycine/betaine ABC transporter substrate-binding protein [Cupriavidus sp.]